MPAQRLRFAGLNFDADPHDYQPGDYPFALNVRLYNPLTQATGEAQALAGHRRYPAAMPTTGVNTVVGAVEAAHLDSVFYFVHNTLGRHSLCQFNYRTLTASRVLEWAGLNLHPDSRVTGAAVVERTLYWTDFRNEPRKLNLERVAQNPALYDRLKLAQPHFLELLRPGPQRALALVRQLEAGRENTLPRAALMASYRFVYDDGETSVLAPWSALLPRPVTDEEKAHNVVRLTVPGAAGLSEQVKRVELLVREGHAGPVTLVASLTRAQVLIAPTYAYYGDQAGLALDPAAVVKPFDYVPLRARALAYVRNRLFTGGNVEGFAVPTATLATALVMGSTLEQPNGNTQPDETNQTVVVQRRSFTYQDEDGAGNVFIRSDSVVAGRWLYVSGVLAAPGSLYVPLSPPTSAHLAPYPTGATPVTWEALHHNNGNLGYGPSDPGFEEYGIDQTLTTTDWTITYPAAVLPGATRCFKSLGSYRFGVQYYDWAGRTPGVSQGTQAVATPDPFFALPQVAVAVRWTLTDPSQIPAWAESYHLVRTRERRHSFFVQGKGRLGYALPETTTAGRTGSYLFHNDDVAGVDSCLVDLSGLLLNGLGYEFAEGDRCRVRYALPAGGSPQLRDLHADVAVLGTQAGGPYLRIEKVPFRPTGTAGGATAFPEVTYEIYTPYKAGEDEPYYEVGPRYAVTEGPGGVRGWEATTGELPGDVYLTAREWYVGAPRTPQPGKEIFEAMNPVDDARWAEWTQDLGRSTGVLRDMKEQDKFAAVRFSNSFTQGAATNGLSSFEPLNEEPMPREDGPVRYLQPVKGNLLVLQEQRAQSAYVGASQLQDIQGKNLISLSDRVVGSHQPLSGGGGCQHPETVRVDEKNGYVYWWDCRSGVVVRYANDGLTPVSGYGMVGYFGQRRRSQLAAEPRPVAWYDALHKEYVLNLGAASDQLGAAFSEALNRWTGFYSAAPDGAVSAGGGVVSFLGSNLYLHDQDADHACRQLGADYPAQVELATALGQPKAVKVFATLVLEGDAGWHAPLITTPGGQASHLDPADFEALEGQYFAAFLRDENTPDADNPLETGDELRSTLLTVRLEHHTPDLPPVPPARLRAATIAATFSSPY